MADEILVDSGEPITDEVLGPAFARALAERDFVKLGSMLDPAVEFVALTPRRTWEASGDADAVGLFRGWFDEETVVDEVEEVVTHAVGDCRHLGYRFRGRDADGPFVVEQQVYFTERDGRINWMRLMCSGFVRR